MMNERFVIYNPEMGVYLGSAMGLGFWSLLDPVGQKYAVTFESEKEIREVLASWDKFEDKYEIRSVHCEDNNYASEKECMAAGLPGWSN